MFSDAPSDFDVCAFSFVADHFIFKSSSANGTDCCSGEAEAERAVGASKMQARLLLQMMFEDVRKTVVASQRPQTNCSHHTSTQCRL